MWMACMVCTDTLVIHCLFKHVLNFISRETAQKISILYFV